MKYDEGSNNVHALFPGIDVTPFGPAAEPNEAGDKGWSATPEQTVVLAAEQTADPPAAAGHRRRLALTAGCVAAAILLGGGIAAGRALLAQPTSHSASSQVASQAAKNAEISTGSRVQAMLRTESERPRRQTDSHRARARHRTRHAATPRTPATQTATPVNYSAPPTTSYQNTTAAAGASNSSATGGSSVSTDDSNSSSQQAGPTGPVSLIGAGTTPSG